METRSYRMGARAEAAAATGERILDAARTLFEQDPGRDATLDEIAGLAGVSVQTVIRRFGGRAGVHDAMIDRAVRRIESQRATAPAGDLEGTVAVLLDHYDEFGDQALRLLADEARSPRIAAIVQSGRDMHVTWCERVFADVVAPLRGVERARRLALLVTVCDVYTWKLLHRDRGLSRAQTQRALCELLEPLVKDA